MIELIDSFKKKSKYLYCFLPILIHIRMNICHAIVGDLQFFGNTFTYNKVTIYFHFYMFFLYTFINWTNVYAKDI